MIFGEEDPKISPEGENIATYDENGVSLFYNDESVARSMLSRRLAKSRPLKLGTCQDLELVDVSSELYPNTDSPDFALKEYIRTFFGERKTPVYIFDDHNHALFAWFEALHEGKIQKGATIYHFDDHLDGRKIGIILPTSLDEISMLAKRLDHASFIDPAIKMGLVKDFFWIATHFTKRREKAEDKWEDSNVQISSDELLSLLDQEHIGPEKAIVDIDVDYFASITPGSERETKEMENIRKVIKKAGVITFAISSGFIDSNRAIDLINKLLLE